MDFLRGSRTYTQQTLSCSGNAYNRVNSSTKISSNQNGNLLGMPNHELVTAYIEFFRQIFM